VEQKVISFEKKKSWDPKLSSSKNDIKVARN